MPATNCHFCSKTEEELVEKNVSLIRSPNKRHRICQDCANKVSLFSLTQNSTHTDPLSADLSLFTPRSIFEHLGQSIMFQENALKAVSLAVYQHIQRISGNYNAKDSKVSKNNVLLFGSSGTGKTAIIKEIESMVDLPIIEANANSITSSGYVGRDATDIIFDLYKESGEDVESTEKGIVFIDEIDKIKMTESGGKDVNGGGVQEALLKLMEGTKVHLYNVEKDIDVYIDTTNILFICAGAFAGISEINSKRSIKQSIGFGSTLKSDPTDFDYTKLDYIDFVEYGFMEEFLGRLSILAPLVKLTLEQYKIMLVKPKNSLFSQIKVLFENENSTFSWTENALEELSKQAMKKNLGARGARNIISKAIDDKLFDISSDNESVDVVLDLDGDKLVLNSITTKAKLSVA